MNILKNALVTGLVFTISLLGYSQETAFLIGDDAPSIKYSKWLKGEPIARFDDNKLYVVEFWATWCGPCIAAMPHLSDLADKYKDKVSFVGVNVWEKIGDKPYESVLPKVTNFVNGMGDKIRYNVAVDNDSLFMAKNWLKNAGVPGIPCTFLIKSGKLLWLGHPKSLDSIIVKVQQGTFDTTGSRQGHQRSWELARKATENDQKLMEPIETAISAKNFDEAFALMDKAISDRPSLKHAMNMKHFTTLLDKVSEKQAIQFAESWINNDGSRVGMYLAQAIADRDGLSKETYGYGAKWFEPASEGTNVNPLIINYLAKCYYLSGDYEKAVKTQEIAVAAADEAVKNNKWSGIILPHTVAEYSELLKKYKEAL